MDLSKKHPSLAAKQAPPTAYSVTFSIMSILAICFLTIITLISAIRSRGDPWALAFVFSVYVLLMLLFLCLNLYDGTPGNSEKREISKICISALMTVLNVTFFAYQVSMIIDVTLKFAMWVIAAFCTISVCCFFIFRNYTNNRYAVDGQSLPDAQI